MAKNNYLDKTVLAQMAQDCQPFITLRNKIYNTYGIDPLDTDTLSSMEIYQIVSQYDPDYNVNFARNGEDAQSKGVLIEQKCTKIPGNTTKTGKIRKGAGTDAAFTFHAMGDLNYPRYIFVARFKHNLAIDRLYDISDPVNVTLVQAHLLAERNAWLARGAANPSAMKRDAILISEKFLLTNLNITQKTQVNNCTVFLA